MSKTINVRVTHRQSTREVGTIFEVKEETILGPLTGWPMHEIIGEIETDKEKMGRTQYIHTKFCERVDV